MTPTTPGHHALPPRLRAVAALLPPELVGVAAYEGDHAHPPRLRLSHGSREVWIADAHDALTVTGATGCRGRDPDLIALIALGALGLKPRDPLAPSASAADDIPADLRAVAARLSPAIVHSSAVPAAGAEPAYLDLIFGQRRAAVSCDLAGVLRVHEVNRAWANGLAGRGAVVATPDDAAALVHRLFDFAAPEPASPEAAWLAACRADAGPARPLEDVVRLAYEKAHARGWDRVYWMVDLHDTAIAATYASGGGITLLPGAGETLRWLLTFPETRIILWSSMSPELLAAHREALFAEADRGRVYLNENPEEGDTAYASFQQKPYFNVLLDDKAGFDHARDWAAVTRAMLRHRVPLAPAAPAAPPRESTALPDALTQVIELARADAKPPLAMVAKLFEESGELAQEVNIAEGHLPHKRPGPDGILGEAADVVQNALCILAASLPDLPPAELLAVFGAKLAEKNGKWAGIMVTKEAA